MSAFKELSGFLRARRARVRPADVGLPEGTGLRRTPGLRREELATIAGISVAYYTRLEQGREANPSPSVLDALAAALGLDEEEHAHLNALAGRTVRRRPAPTREVRTGILRLLETVRPSPAYVLSRTSDVLAANPEGLALFAGLGDWPPERRNTIRYTFLHPTARTLFADWDAAAAGTAANLRSLVTVDPDSPELAALVEELTAGCPEFPALWERYDVRRRRGEQKVFHHPLVGKVTFTTEVLHFGGDGQRMTLYQAEPGGADHDAVVNLSRLLAD